MVWDSISEGICLAEKVTAIIKEKSQVIENPRSFTYREIPGTLKKFSKERTAKSIMRNIKNT